VKHELAKSTRRGETRETRVKGGMNINIVIIIYSYHLSLLSSRSPLAIKIADLHQVLSVYSREG